ncbi:NADPH-dependent F420 reductase [Nocardia brasiliensis]|uniref:Glycerol-3-phosphate dehydrogenase n=1 Tax=Nocardia brasiliensis (strain ATCC 700358 / HUJEG-1) TaxID=1133849 RepID=K0F7N7_NOCB7|nr:NAD(P)-binding domain-containing protein [Nocardia brasiliensis]AFU05734.1 glycerol-3-phosphate dehydrogenase [Nocardia brasiliensis ATCC 700358]OCF89922.1 NADP oxidoreductase [Nocardia brasiliensis]
MRIGIIGAGAMARALGGGWVGAGHEVLVGARSAAAAQEAAAAIGARAGSVRAAAEFGEVVLLALPVDALDEVLRPLAGLLAGRTLVDCTNAFAPDNAAPAGATGFVLSEAAVAERIAATAPDAHVVKAFNMCAAEVWAADARVFDERRLAVPLCGDDPRALAQVAGLAEDLALQPIPAGGLHRARYLEAVAVFTVGLWFAGHDARAAFPPLTAAFAVVD